MKAIFTFLLLSAFCIFLILLIIFLVRGLRKKELHKSLSICLSGFILCTVILFVMLYPGSEAGIKLNGFVVNLKTPTGLEKLTGKDVSILSLTNSGTISSTVSIATKPTTATGLGLRILESSNVTLYKQQSGNNLDFTLNPGGNIQISVPTTQFTGLPIAGQTLNPLSPFKSANTPKQ